MAVLKVYKVKSRDQTVNIVSKLLLHIFNFRLFSVSKFEGPFIEGHQRNRRLCRRFIRRACFLWLIVTVLLQNRDLNLQYNEIKDMRAASESQAQSLKSSQVFQTLEFLEVKLENISEYVCQRRNLVIKELETFSKENGTLYNGKTMLDLADAMDYFIINSSDPNALKFELSNIRNDFTYQSYLRVQAIYMNIEEVVVAYNSLMINVPENIKSQITDYINAHKMYLMVDWYDKMLPYTERLYRVLMRAAVEHGIGTEANRHLLKIFADQDS